jgi:putative heme-binding domain-containing protein
MMRIVCVPSVPLAITLFLGLHLNLARGQQPAPVENVSSFPPRTAAEEQKALHAPPGFEIQLVASDPEINKPLNLAFDDRGRLWVTSTVEYPYPAQDGTRPRDSVKILSNFRADGRAQKVETFADGLNIPIGLLPMPSARAAIVHNIPNIYMLKDTDGDGRADTREALYGVFGNRDTHGMTNAFTWGFDGWIYACHGYANDSKVQGSDHRPISMNSGNTYRLRADGSHAEYFTHGQVNPFGLAFDPLDNLYSCDCHSQPLYQLLRGAFYPSFGKPDDGLGFGPEMVNTDHGSTGIGGISFYTADQYPEAYRGTTFIGNVVTNRINHDRIEWHGSSPKGFQQADFVWSEDNWFHPVDIELGPDGALYVADFYNSIIGHYEVPLTHPARDRERGRIWRVVYRGNDGKPAPAPSTIDRTRSTVDELIKDLAHPNLVVRITAANQLVDRGGAEGLSGVRTVVGNGPPVRQRVHALWVLHRQNALDEATLVACARDQDRELRVHSLKALAERSEISPTCSDLAKSRLSDSDPFVRRAAAEVLGRHPAVSNIKPLLELRQSAPADDTHLIHVARMALRDQLLDSSVWPQLAKLEQSERDRRDLADVATGVHTPEAAAFLLHQIKQLEYPQETLARFVHHIARYGAQDSTANLAAFANPRKRTSAQRLELLKAIQQGFQERGVPLGQEARQEAARLAGELLASSASADITLGIDVVRDFEFRDMQASLVQVIERTDLPEQPRSHAMGALSVIDPKANLPTLEKVLGDAAKPMGMRQWAANLLGGIDRAEAKAALLNVLPVAPEQLQGAVASALVRRRPGADALLNAIASGKASARLLQDRSVTITLESSGLPKVADRIAALLKGLPPADAKLTALFNRRRDGFQHAKPDAGIGAKVFEKHCAVCHQMSGRGAKVGPQLDGIGTRGLDRLMEDILDPNRNVDQTLRVTNLALKNGQVVSGLLMREEGEVLIVADAQGKEVRVPRTTVDERSASPLSPMPANLVDQIDEADFYNLMAFLLSKRDAATAAPHTGGSN